MSEPNIWGVAILLIAGTGFLIALWEEEHENPENNRKRKKARKAKSPRNTDRKRLADKLRPRRKDVSDGGKKVSSRTEKGK